VSAKPRKFLSISGVTRVRWLGADQISVRIGPLGYSARTSARRLAILAGLLVAVFVLMVVSLSVGPYSVSPYRVLLSLFGSGDRITDFIVQTLRLPRVLDAVLAGFAFGMSGAIFQSLLRNPLATPDVLGVESGAAAAAVFVIVSSGGASSTRVAAAALVGGITVALAVYVLGYGRRGSSGYRMILIGISVAAVLSSVTLYMLTRASIFQDQEAAFWLTGNLNDRAWSDLYPVAIALAAILPFTPIFTRQLSALQLGEETARGLGAAAEKNRISLILAAAVLAAAATASAGPVVFVALAAPQLARRLLRTASPTLVGAGLVGATLICASDLIGRVVIAPTEEPVGIITAILGAPYFLWLLTRSSRIAA
jgi:iron-siderophore transport system permease protein